MTNTLGRQVGLNRRTVLQIFAVAGAAGALRFWPFNLEDTGLHVVRQSRPMLGTMLNLTVGGRDRDQAEAAVAATIGRMLAIERRLSRHRENSEVAELNRTGTLFAAGDDLLAVLRLAETVSRQTGGAFDITVLPLLALYRRYKGEALLSQPSLLDQARQGVGQAGLRVDGRQVRLARPEMGITLDGIGKGYVVDQGVATLAEFGCNQVFVEAGGDLLVKGGKPQGQPWRIGVRNPRPAMAGKLVTIEAVDLAVATSGDYFQAFTPDLRLHHIINPRTGFSAPELASCTITAPTAAQADALATGCMVLGVEAAMDLLAGLPDCEGYFITKGLVTYRTPGFAG